MRTVCTTLMFNPANQPVMPSFLNSVKGRHREGDSALENLDEHVHGVGVGLLLIVLVSLLLGGGALQGAKTSLSELNWVGNDRGGSLGDGASPEDLPRIEALAALGESGLLHQCDNLVVNLWDLATQMVEKKNGRQSESWGLRRE